MSETYLNKYFGFVDEVTSKPSTDKDHFLTRIEELYDQGCNVARLHTAADGLAAESGEFMEIVKKITFQGKPYDEANIFHMKRELGDVMWYWANACMALGLDPYEVIDENIVKLESRFPGGKFSIERSEKRAEGDL